MIGNLVLSFVFSFLQFLITIFPASVGFPPAAATALSSIGGYFGMFDSLIPLSTLLSVLLLVFGAEIAVWSFRSLKWIISHIPLIGGLG